MLVPLSPISARPVKANVLEATNAPLDVRVPVNVGLAASALLVIAVAMLVYSASISVPRTTLFALPEGRESLAAKLVVFV